MRRRRKSLSWVAVGLLAACSSASVGPNTDARTIRSLYDNGTAGIASRQDAIRRFGAPTRLEVTEVNPTSRDSMIVVTHPGRLHRFLRSGARRRDFLVEAQLSQPGATLPGPIRIGRTTRADLAALPAWDEETTTGDTTVVAWKRPDELTPSWVEVSLVRDTVRLVRWLPYVE